MRRLSSFLEYSSSETRIHPSEAMSGLGAIQTLLDNKRDLGFFVEQDFIIHPQFAQKYDELIERGFKRKNIGGENRSFIVYAANREADAEELKKIALKYDGYLSYKTTDEESRRIGDILRYDPVEIEKFINRKKKNK